MPSATPDRHRRIVLAARPEGAPRASDFRIETARAPDLAPGQFMIANKILSIDPAIRGFLDDRESYLPPVALGETVRGMTLGQVVASRRADMPEGAYVRALAGWEEFSVLGDALGLEIVAAGDGAPLEHYMGALGPAGLTAWVGLHEIGAIAPGQTVVVSAAAGAVGSVAGQIARLRVCRVIGIVGGAAKTEQIRALGYHAAVDYRAEPDLAAALRAACPEGADIFFDNVGGQVLETMLPLMREHGRVVVCGMIADYNSQDEPYGVRTLWQLVVKRIQMRGFLTYDHPDALPQAQRDLTAWVREGALMPLQNVRDGIENAPEAFIDLMSGRTTGKTLVRII